MTPKIVTRLANIAAKLAGSDKYDPTIEPVTAFEYYLDKGVDKILAIKGVPAAEVSDKGKVLSVSNSGAPVWKDGPLVVTFSGTSVQKNASCDKTWAEIKAAGSNIELWYQQNNSKTKLVPVIYPTGIYGEFTYISDPADVPGGYTSITCGILSNGGVECTVVDG